jgi:hypothetical protein
VKRVQAQSGSHVHTATRPLHIGRPTTASRTARFEARDSLPTYRGSTPRVGVKAATAAGQHPYPSRTRKLSPPAFRRVLEYESLWEIRFAASIPTASPPRVTTLSLRTHTRSPLPVSTPSRFPCRTTAWHTAPVPSVSGDYHSGFAHNRSRVTLSEFVHNRPPVTTQSLPRTGTRPSRGRHRAVSARPVPAGGLSVECSPAA